jgi:hypothetical protein
VRRDEELSQLRAKITIAPRYPHLRKDGERVMKKILILAAAIAVSVSQYEAKASLLGMPLNLKSALEARDARAPAQACEFYTDDVFAGPVLIRGC